MLCSDVRSCSQLLVRLPFTLCLLKMWNSFFSVTNHRHVIIRYQPIIGTGVTAAVTRNFNDADRLSVLARLAGSDALSSASPSLVLAGSDVASFHVNAFCSDSGNNSHHFITGSKTVAITNGCEAVSALLNAKRSSGAARRSRLKSAMVYTSLELIRSSWVLAAGSVHNVLSLVTYQSVSSSLKVYPDRRMREYILALLKTAGFWQSWSVLILTDSTGCACDYSLLHVMYMAFRPVIYMPNLNVGFLVWQPIIGYMPDYRTTNAQFTTLLLLLF